MGNERVLLCFGILFVSLHPRGVHNITVIENIHNFNQMYICNPCADLYFGIQESLKIESTVRRLKKNKDLNMDDICLAYLFRNKFIDRLELKNYRLVRLSRKDEYSRFYRQRINKRIINFRIMPINQFLKRLKFSLRGARRWKTHIVFLYLLKNGRS